VLLAASTFILSKTIQSTAQHNVGMTMRITCIVQVLDAMMRLLHTNTAFVSHHKFGQTRMNVLLNNQKSNTLGFELHLEEIF